MSCLGESGIQWRKNLRTTKARSTRNTAISHNSPLLSSSSFILRFRGTNSGGTDRVTNSRRMTETFSCCCRMHKYQVVLVSCDPAGITLAVWLASGCSLLSLAPNSANQSPRKTRSLDAAQLTYLNSDGARCCQAAEVRIWWSWLP